MMLASLNRRTITLRAAWLAMIVVAGSQLVLAGHQFQHDGVTGNEVCTTCVQLDEFDAPVTLAPANPPLSSQLPVVLPDRGSLIDRLSLSPYSSRAPPRVC